VEANSLNRTYQQIIERLAMMAHRSTPRSVSSSSGRTAEKAGPCVKPDISFSGALNNAAMIEEAFTDEIQVRA